MLDVDGWHSGRLEGSSPRIMIQLKFTTGNDLLHAYQLSSQKAKKQIQKSMKN